MIMIGCTSKPNGEEEERAMRYVRDKTTITCRNAANRESKKKQTKTIQLVDCGLRYSVVKYKAYYYTFLPHTLYSVLCVRGIECVALNIKVTKGL